MILLVLAPTSPFMCFLIVSFIACCRLICVFKTEGTMQGVSDRPVKGECVCTVLSSSSYIQFALRAHAEDTVWISGAKRAHFRWSSVHSRCLDMKMTTKAAMLAEVEDDIDGEDDGNSQDSDKGVSSSEICTFDVPYFRYIDDEDVEEGKEKEISNGSHHYRCSSERDCCPSSSRRYVVVSGTPLKILEHLLSDLRLEDQRGAAESRESGKFQPPYETAVIKAWVGKRMKS